MKEVNLVIELSHNKATRLHKLDSSLNDSIHVSRHLSVSWALRPILGPTPKLKFSILHFSNNWPKSAFTTRIEDGGRCNLKIL